MQLDDIQEEILQKVNTAIKITTPYDAPSRTRVGKKHLGEARTIDNHLTACSNYINKHYRRTFGWIPANPSKQAVCDAIKSVYIRSDTKGTTSTNIVNTSQGHIRFYLDIVRKKRPNTIFLIGPKGSGKTFYLNYLVNTRNTELYKNSIVWYRAELSKLYKHNIKITSVLAADPSSKARRYSLEEYLAIHIAYVSFKYRHNNAVFQQVWDDQDDFISNLIIDKWNVVKQYRQDLKHPNLLVEEFKQFVREAEAEERHHGIDLAKKHIQSLIESSENAVKSVLLADVILSYLKKCGFAPLFIIDGLDNIDYYDHADHYESIISQVREFCLRDDKKTNFNAKVIVSVRDETFEHLRLKALNFFDNTNPPTYRVLPDNPGAILRRRVSVALNPDCEYFKDSRIEANSEIDEFYQHNHETYDSNKGRLGCIRKADRSLQLFINNGIEKLCRAIRNRIPRELIPEEIDESFLFSCLYNHNLRAFINNMLNIYSYHRLFVEKKKHIDTSHLRSYVLTEGQLLNGSLYLNTRGKPYEFGKCIPNIFYFDKTYFLNTWHGLCSLRMLQLLNNKPRCEEELYELIKSYFCYHTEIIKKNFCFLLSHGLLECNFDTDSKKRLFRLTEKGDFITKYIFLDLNVFYYLSIDTPLSNHAIKRSRLIKVHSNSGNYYWENYIESCVLTSLTFMRHILTQHNSELFQLPYEEQYIFNMPGYFPGHLIKEIMKQIEVLSKFKDESRMESLRLDIEGIPPSPV